MPADNGNQWEARITPITQGSNYWAGGYRSILAIRRTGNSESFMDIYHMSEADFRQLVWAVNKFAVEHGNAS